ncbi:MAG: endo-alpha-N-acetylgalactosaminidase family protein [Lentisphaeria bacterium]|nr:endo-alpha-N-acetylgalactosaminidase family protein [Lentisphaeria bacterium]
MTNEPSGDYYDYTQTMRPERPWMLPYHQSLVFLTMTCTRGGDGKVDKIYQTFEQTLAMTRRIYNLTLGVPQINYLVGWHHEGHDSKYPDWSEVNRHLKRAEDPTALDSLRWLIREARAYNTTISLHLNMMDAYPDSPLWDEYVAKDIIAKDERGEIIKGKEWGGMASYQMSYTQEWKTGMAQKRIDGIIEMIPELVEGGTIHIDAFLGERPGEGRGQLISPYLGYTKEEELATQRKIFRYWRDRGIDVTSEWADGLRGDYFIGLQAWCWHGASACSHVPDYLHCGNPMQDAKHPGFDQENGLHEKYKEEFYLLFVPWYYKNNPAGTEDIQTMVDGDNICMPALWCDEKTIIAYSKEGVENKSWTLRGDWRGVTKVSVARLSQDEPETIGTLPVVGGKLTLSLSADEAVKITPVC